LDTQGQCNLIRTKNVYCKTYKNTYTMYNIKIYKIYDIYKYDMFIILSVFNVHKNYVKRKL